jgi:hypothetical protein
MLHRPRDWADLEVMIWLTTNSYGALIAKMYEALYQGLIAFFFVASVSMRHDGAPDEPYEALEGVKRPHFNSRAFAASGTSLSHLNVHARV